MIQYLRSGKRACAFLALAALLPSATAFAQNVRMGVYYYPGWSPNIAEAVHKLPWAPIGRFPNRLPAIGEYVDGDPKVLRTQLDQMKAGEISFVVFDSYVGTGGAVRSDQSINAYMAVAGRGDPEFAMLWDNSDKSIKTMADWTTLISTWSDRYFRDPRYVRLNGMPMLMVFSAAVLDTTAASFGATGAQLLANAQTIAKAHGLPGISFVAGAGPNSPMARGLAAFEGYTALSEYNMSALGSAGTGYTRRDVAYRNYWKSYVQNSSLPVILPLTVGWDKTPWGGSKEDGALPTPAQFASHVDAALSYMRRGNTEATRMGVICCWNEYGEGSILEPTRGNGNGYLKALKNQLDKEGQ